MKEERLQRIFEEAESLPSSERENYIKSSLTKDEIVEAIAYSYRFDHTTCLNNLLSQKKYVLPAVMINGDILRKVDERFRDDKDVVLAAVSMDGYVLEYASKNLQADYDVVLTAVKSWGRALQYANEKLIDNQIIVEAAINEDPLAIVYAGKKYKKNKEYVLNALEAYKCIDSSIFYDFEYYISNELLKLVKYHKNDYEVIYETASCKHGRFKKLLATLKELKSKLYYDEEIVRKSVISNADSYEDIPIKYQENKDIATIAVKNGYPVDELHESLRNDRSLILTSVTYNGKYLYRYNEYQNDLEIVLAAVRSNGLALEYASDELKNYKYVVKAAVTNVAEALTFASSDIKHDDEFIIELLKVNPYVIAYASYNIKHEFIYFYKKIMTNKESGLYIDKMYDSITTNVDLILECITRYSNYDEIIKIVVENFIKYIENSNTIDKNNNNTAKYLKEIEETIQKEEEIIQKEDRLSDFIRYRRACNKRWKHNSYGLNNSRNGL